MPYRGPLPVPAVQYHFIIQYLDKVQKRVSLMYDGPNFPDFFLKAAHYEVQWSVKPREKEGTTTQCACTLKPAH